MRMDDGFSTIVSFSNYPSVKFYEKEVTPPGVSGGGPIDTTTMRNTAYRTKKPKKLKSVDSATFTAAYDPAVYTDIADMIQELQQITHTFPDGETLQNWGWVESFVPNANTEGEQPTATVTLEFSNQNADGEEVPYTFEGATGSSGA